MPAPTPSTVKPTIPALVTRHAGDAAFYWSQWDASAHSPLVGLAQLAQFDRLLTAHLDGLRVAGAAGWDRALHELTRWQGAGEAFVCTLLALESEAAGARLKAVWDVLARDPRRMLRGLISAFAWSDERHARPWIGHWLADDGVPATLQVAAWRAVHLMRNPARIALGVTEKALASPQAAVRAAACRSLGASACERIGAMLTDEERTVRAEAAIAGASTARAACVPVLWQAVVDLAREYAALTGRPRHDARRRLERWVRHLGLTVPPGYPGIAGLLAGLPPRQALLFILHHGDCAYLPLALEYLDHPDAARLAGWVWAMLSGVDLERAGLCRPPTALDGDPRPTDDLDPGLPDPDSARIRAYPLSLTTSQPVLLGATLTAARLPGILRDAPQALRWIAARRLALGSGPCIDTRAQLPDQLARMALFAERAA